MFSRMRTTAYTENCWDSIARLREEINKADAIVIGAGAGLSAAAGFSYSGNRFYENFSDFNKKYGITDMYSGGFYTFETLEEYWAWWSRMIYINRYAAPVGQPYKELLDIVKDKNYFVITTNVDHQFQLAGFDKKRLFYTQGDYGLWQCSKPCHNKTYDNKEAVFEMVKNQEDMRIPSELIPKCPLCGEPMTMNLRADDTFVQDEGWYRANNCYNDFLRRHSDLNVLFLELGVGMNTPGIIKYHFWQMTLNNKNAVYCCVNMGEAWCPKEIEKQSVCVNMDLARFVSELRGRL